MDAEPRSLGRFTIIFPATSAAPREKVFQILIEIKIRCAETDAWAGQLLRIFTVGTKVK
jgi:hypothetical protein